MSQTRRGYSCRAWLMDQGTNGRGRGTGLGNSIGWWVIPQPTARVWDPPQQCTHLVAWVLLDARPYTTEATQPPLGRLLQLVLHRFAQQQPSATQGPMGSLHDPGRSRCDFPHLGNSTSQP